MMTREELAARLLAADYAGRVELFNKHSTLVDVDLAHRLETLFYDARVSDLARAQLAATALDHLSGCLDRAEVAALSDWVNGIAALEIEGKAELALARLTRAAAQFTKLGRPLQTASTEVSKLR